MHILKKISNKIDRFYLLLLGLFIIYAIQYFHCYCNKEGLSIPGKSIKEKQEFIEKVITQSDIKTKKSGFVDAKKKCKDMSDINKKTSCLMHLEKTKDDARSSCQAFSLDENKCFTKIYNPKSLF